MENHPPGNGRPPGRTTCFGKILVFFAAVLIIFKKATACLAPEMANFNQAHEQRAGPVLGILKTVIQRLLH